MSHPAYPEYKPSEQVGLDVIPAHWATTKVKYSARCLDGKRIPLNGEQRGSMQGEYPYWGANGIVDHIDKWLFDEDLVLLGEDGAPFFEPHKDVAFNVSGKVWVNNHAHVLRPNGKLHQRFLTYALNCVDYSLYIKGSTRDKLNQSDMGSINLWFPSDEEQSTIANFLDRETAKIDNLIDKQEQLIKLLEEKRQAVISHAVTKGLNPDVRMKDSGVQWLGMVPEHWKLVRLKFVGVVQTGIALGKTYPKDVETEVHPYLRVANVQDGYLDLNDISEIEVTAYEARRYRLESGDVLMNEGGDNDKLGRGAIWNGEIDDCLHQNHVFSIRVSGVEPKWLSLFTQSHSSKFFFYSVAKQTTNLASVSSSNLRNLILPMPPADERAAIFRRVSDRCAGFDHSLRSSREMVALLRERRTALISAAVTGKIDVRQAS